MDNLRNTYGSSIEEHLIDNRDCAEMFTVDFFSDLSLPHSSVHLKVLEIIHILSGRLSHRKQRKHLLGLNINLAWSPI